jgi:replicative DNA helicase
VLGAILLESQAFDLVSHYLNPNSFYVEKHKKYFANNINTFPNSLRVFNEYQTVWTKTELNENQTNVLTTLKKYYGI